MFSFIAFTVLVASVLMVLGNLREVARDTLDAVKPLSSGNRALPNVAFSLLWLLIIGLSYV